MSLQETIASECTKLVEDVNSGKYTHEELTKIQDLLREINYSPDAFEDRGVDPQTALYLIRGMILTMAMEKK